MAFISLWQCHIVTVSARTSFLLFSALGTANPVVWYWVYWGTFNWWFTLAMTNEAQWELQSDWIYKYWFLYNYTMYINIHKYKSSIHTCVDHIVATLSVIWLQRIKNITSQPLRDEWIKHRWTDRRKRVFLTNKLKYLFFLCIRVASMVM